jgi:hypothetical protein
MSMSSDALRAFRRNAVQVRLGLAGLTHTEGRLEVDRGQIRDANLIERYKRLAIPVRRALKTTDRVAFATALEAVREAEGPAGAEGNTGFVGFEGFPDTEREWTTLQAELDSTVTFGGVKVARRKILDGFLDAAAFYDQLDRDKAYNAFIEEWGTAAEGLGGQLTEDAARVIVALDTLAARVLGEPEILPPPEKTPPPPPDPKEPLLKRIWALIRPDEPRT